MKEDTKGDERLFKQQIPTDACDVKAQEAGMKKPGFFYKPNPVVSLVFGFLGLNPVFKKTPLDVYGIFHGFYRKSLESALSDNVHIK